MSDCPHGRPQRQYCEACLYGDLQADPKSLDVGAILECAVDRTISATLSKFGPGVYEMAKRQLAERWLRDAVLWDGLEATMVDPFPSTGGYVYGTLRVQFALNVLPAKPLPQMVNGLLRRPCRIVGR